MMVEEQELVGTVVPRYKITAEVGFYTIEVQWFEVIKVTHTPEEGDQEDSVRTFYRYNPVGIFPRSKEVRKLNLFEDYYGLEEVIECD